MKKPLFFDVIIVGGGMVGATLALALAKQTSLSIAVLEKAQRFNEWSRDAYHHRVSAITLASQRIFINLKVWDAIIGKRVSPFKRIEVWDAKTQGEIQFDAQTVSELKLGYIIENNVIQSALIEQLAKEETVKMFMGTELYNLDTQAEVNELVTSHGTMQAKLIVAADGANSWLREAARIPVSKRSYQQTAIVATVETESSHEQIARQVFLPQGPLAFLPLQNPQLSSIVWSLPTDEAARIAKLESDAFKDLLAKTFDYRLGKIVECSERYVFPLLQQTATQYQAPRFALVGDAAHTVHPLAGLGVNMGLLDAASLAELIVEACLKQRDIGESPLLRRYERWRKAENMVTASTINMIKQVFASDLATFTQMRRLGLSVTNRNLWLKNFFTTHAIGNHNKLPSIAKSISHSF